MIVLPSRYSYLLYDAPEKGFFKGCLMEHSKEQTGIVSFNRNFSGISERQKPTAKQRFGAFFAHAHACSSRTTPISAQSHFATKIVSLILPGAWRRKEMKGFPWYDFLGWASDGLGSRFRDRRSPA